MLRGSFTLRSGSVSDRYFDKYLFASDPVLLSEVADRLAPLIPRGTEVLAGLELGGVPVDTALCVLDRSDGHPDPQQEMGITLISLSTAQDVGW
jgi:orotate phosphoribosyltransferase